MTSSQPSRQVRRAALRSGGNAMAHPIPSDDATSPLPRNRSLALSRPGTLARLRGWLRGLLIPARTPDRRRLAASPAAAAQIRALRGDVARLQRSLDRLLDASS